jgi:hypothetical protein
VLTNFTGSWHTVYAVGCGMNIVAALLGFFVLRPIINERLKPTARPSPSQMPLAA